MTYKQIEASKELRLWIGQVIVPAATAVTVMLVNPDVRNFAYEAMNRIKTKLQKK